MKPGDVVARRVGALCAGICLFVCTAAVLGGEAEEFTYLHAGRPVVLRAAAHVVAVPSAARLAGTGAWRRDARGAAPALAAHGLELLEREAAAGKAATARIAGTALQLAREQGLPAQPVFELGPALKVASDEVIVAFDGPADAETAREFIRRHADGLGLVGVRPLRPRTFVVRIARAEFGRAFDVSRALAALPGVSYAEPNLLSVLDAPVPEPRPAFEPPAPRPAKPERLGGPQAGPPAGPPAPPPAAPGWVTLVQEDFEDAPQDWITAFADGATAAQPALTQARAHSGTGAAYMTGGGAAGVAPPGPYPVFCDALMFSPVFDLAGFEEAYVEAWFFARYEDPRLDPFQLWDFGQLALYDPNTGELAGELLATVYTGDLTADPTTRNGWRRVLFRVPPAMRRDGVQVLVRFISDESNGAEGMYVDDVRVVASADVDASPLGNDTYGGRQYELSNAGQLAGLGGPGQDLGAPEAWEHAGVDPGIVLAIIDSGVEPHEDLNLVTGYDADTGGVGGAPKSAGDNHGQACAGNAGAIAGNGLGVAGTAPGVKIMPVHFGTSDAATATAIDLAVAHGAHILSNSWGWVGAPNATIEAAVNDALAAGRTVLFAAGNGPDRPPFTYQTVFPCSMTETTDVICVGASSPTDEHKNASSSDGVHTWGSSYVGPGPDVVAPGPWSYTTDRPGAAGYNADPAVSGLDADYTHDFGGTSSATPKVAGIAALLLSLDPTLTPGQVKSILRESAQDIDAAGFDDRTGAGRVDALAAVLLAGGGQNPAPTLNQLSPSAATAGGPAFTLVVTGSGFVSGSQVLWNGGARPTTFVGSTELRAQISAADIASGGQAQVTVTSPPPGGGTSGALAFAITVPAGPDLVASWTALAQKCKVKKGTIKCSLKGSVNVRNSGTEIAPKSTVAFVVSDDPVLDGEDGLLRFGSTAKLKPGASKRVKLAYKIPTGYTASGLYVLAFVDAEGIVAESDESNNLASAGPVP
ncbi:MAG: S8 family serine peptidase [Acidobacteria bacterium]|nr:S8 family serine peptidase [Acidobacteriota bacterium]